MSFFFASQDSPRVCLAGVATVRFWPFEFAPQWSAAEAGGTAPSGGGWFLAGSAQVWSGLVVWGWAALLVGCREH